MNVLKKSFPKTIRDLVDTFREDCLEQDAFITESESADRITYRQLREEIRNVAAEMLVLGIKARSRIGLLSENRIEWAVTYLAATYIGAVIVPLDVFMEAEDLVGVLKAANLRLLVVSSRFESKVRQLNPFDFGIETIIHFAKDAVFVGLKGYEENNASDVSKVVNGEWNSNQWIEYAHFSASGRAHLRQGASSIDKIIVEPEQPAVMVYTHGKLFAELSHGGLMANMAAISEVLSDGGKYLHAGQKWLACLPYHHTYPAMMGVLFPLGHHNTVTILSSFKVKDLVRTIKENKINYLSVVPVQLEEFFNLIKEEKTPLGSLGYIITGGAPIKKSIIEGLSALGIKVLQGYGLTEYSPVISVTPPADARAGSVGLPLPGIEIKIVREGSQGFGELLVRGPSLMLGYFNSPEETSAMVKDGWLQTGDLVKQDEDGFVYVVGRKRNIVVNKGGKNVFLSDIENEVQQSDFVADVVIRPAYHEVHGEIASATVLPDFAQVSRYESAQGKRLKEAELKKLISEEIAGQFKYKAKYKVPAKIELVFEREEILSLRNSISDYMFEDIYQDAGGGDGGRASVDRQIALDEGLYVGDVELFIKSEISKVLSQDVSKIDAGEGFVDYLDSIEVKTITVIIEDKLKIKANPTIFFECKNIRDLAAYLARESYKEIAAFFGPKTAARPQGLHAESARAPVQQRNEMRTKDIGEEAVAIIGVECVFPQSENKDEFWENLLQGRNLISEIPKYRFDWEAIYGEVADERYRTITKWGGFVEDIDKFDARFFKISPKEAELMDPQQRLFLETAWKTFEDAGYSPYCLPSRKVGVFAGVGTSDYLCMQLQRGVMEAHTPSGCAHSVLANRISYLLNFDGPSEAIDTACSSSLVALHRAAQSILNSECELALVGGVNALLAPELFVALSKAGMMSKDGQCKTFDKTANGYVRGEGCGAVLLKPLSKAKEDGDNIYAIIRGTAVNHGGRSASLTAPDPTAQANLLIDAYKRAGVCPETISYIEAHGTGTELGDPIEINGLKRAFRELFNQTNLKEAPEHFCGIGSVKTNIGHLEAAAGIAGLIKVLLSMRGKTLPATINFNELNPYISLEKSPFYIVGSNTPWARPVDRHGVTAPRRAGVSSFGFGGSNAHVVIEEYIEEAPALSLSPQAYIFPFSAKSKEALVATARNMVSYLRDEDEGAEPDVALESRELLDIAYTLLVGRENWDERLAVVASSKRELRESLLRYCEQQEQASGLYWGSVKETNVIARQLIDGKEGREFLRIVFDEGKLEKVASLWVCGADVTWKERYAEKNPKRISLPTYPFQKDKYWLQPAAVAVPGAVRRMDVTESVPQQLVTEAYSSESESGKDAVDAGDLQTLVQRDLLSMVSSILNVDENDLSLQEDMSEYGFDSITLTKFAHAINTQFGLKISPALFFGHNTIGSLCGFLQKEHRQQLANCYQSIEAARPAPARVAGHEEKYPVTPASAVNISSDVAVNKYSVGGATSSAPEHLEDQIAVVGMAGKMPQSEDLSEFWLHISNGRDLVTEIPAERWSWEDHYGDPKRDVNKTNAKWGGFIKGVGMFDASFFGISPREAEGMDPQQRIFLETAWNALEDAGYSATSLAGSNTGVFVGVVTSDYSQYLDETKLEIDPYMATGVPHCMIANRTSFYFNFHGPSEAIDTACSSSLVAIYRAMESIRNGDCDMAIAGGVNLVLNPAINISLSKAGMMSIDGRCKTFDKSANGYVRGEGAGAIVLKSLRKARAEGDHIYGVVKGAAVNHGGRANSLTAPNPAAQAQLLLTAYTRANIDPSTVTYIEAHGTGTALGDPIEINGIKDAFKQLYAQNSLPSPVNAHCGIGSVKTNIGHLEGAAGIAGVMKVLLAMKYNRLPGNVHLKEVNPYIDLTGSPFYLVDQAQEWKASVDRQGMLIPRRAGVSSFGFGGSNGHVVLEEYIPDSRRVIPDEQPTAIPLSARSPEQLKEYADKLLSAVQENHHQLIDIAYTLQIGRVALDYRVAFIAANIEDLKSGLARYLTGMAPDNDFVVGVSVRKKNRTTADSKSVRIDETTDRRETLVELCSQWVNGAELDWSRLHADQIPRRVSLPTYPFNREKYWVTFVDRPSARSAVNAAMPAKTHPMIDKYESHADGMTFSSYFTGMEFFVADHVVQTQRVLPGAAYVELVRAAGELATGKKIRAIREVSWTIPMMLNQPQKVTTSFRKEPSDFSYKVTTQEANKTHVNSTGTVIFEHEDRPTVMQEHVGVKFASLPHGISKAECYRMFESTGLNYGPEFQVIEELRYNEGEAVSRLALRPDEGMVPEGVVLHPALLDGAQQTVLGLLLNSNIDKSIPYVPFSVGEISIFGSIPPTCYAYVTYSKKSKSEGANIKSFDIAVVDQNGNVLVKMEEFSFRAMLLNKNSAKSRDVERLMYTTEWEASAPLASSEKALSGKTVLLFDRNEVVGEQLRSLPNGLAPDAVILVKPGRAFSENNATTFEIDPSKSDDYSKLINLLASRNLLPQTIIHLWAYSASDSINATLQDRLRIAPYSLLFLTQSLMAERVKRGIELIYAYKGDMPDTVAFASLDGFVKTVNLENSAYSFRAVEMVEPLGEKSAGGEQPIIPVLLNELGQRDKCYAKVRYLNGARYVQATRLLEQIGSANDHEKFNQGGVYVITGGVGGLGLIFAQDIASQVKAKIALLGRSALSADKSAMIEGIRSLGSEVSYFKVDVADSNAVQVTIDTIKNRYGSITGVIHCAGALRDAFIVKKQEAEFNEVLTGKIYGAINLDQATRNEPLDFFVMFSSIAAMTGNPGQSDYAYANSFLDKYAAERDKQRIAGKRSGKTLSINWPLWNEGGMTVDETSRTLFKKTMGTDPLSTKSGLEAFAIGLSCPKSQMLVLEGEAQKIEKLLLARDLVTIPREKTERSNPGSGVDQLSAKISGYIIGEIAKILKQSPDKLDPEKEFSDYGFDSIGLMSFASTLSDGPNIALSPSVFFDYPNVRLFSEYLYENHREAFVEFLQLTDSAPSPDLDSQEVIYIGSGANTESAEGDRPNLAHVDPLAVVDEATTLLGVYGLEELVNSYPEIKARHRSKGLLRGVGGEAYLKVLSDQKHVTHLLVKTDSNEKIEVFCCGRGKPIVMLSGFGMTAPIWSNQIDAWSNNYQVIVIHKPGHGLSELKHSLSLDSIGKQVIDVLNALNVTTPAHLVGACYGGIIAQHISYLFPERVASLLLACSTYQLKIGEFKSFKVDKVFDAFLDIGKRDFDNVIKATKSKYLVRSRDDFYQKTLNSVSIDPFVALKYIDQLANASSFNVLDKIDRPALLISGKQDAFINLEDARVLKSKLRNSRLKVILDAGHFPFITHANQFNKAALDFFASQERQQMPSLSIKGIRQLVSGAIGAFVK